MYLVPILLHISPYFIYNDLYLFFIAVTYIHIFRNITDNAIKCDFSRVFITDVLHYINITKSILSRYMMIVLK